MTDLRANALCAEFVRGKIREHRARPCDRRRCCARTQPIGCKRLCVDDRLLRDLQPAERHAGGRQPRNRSSAITPHGLRTGGREHALRHAGAGHRLRRLHRHADAHRLARPRRRCASSDKWRGGPLNYLGLTVAGFPNLFNLVGAGSTSAFTSVIVSIEHHVDWIADCIAVARCARPRDDRGHRRGRSALGRADVNADRRSRPCS